MRNMAISNNTIRRGIDALRKRLPDEWSVEVLSDGSRSRDAVVSIRAPDHSEVRFRTPAKVNLTGAAVRSLITELEKAGAGEPEILVIGRFLSPLARQRLSEAKISYLDLTGNVRIRSNAPALWIASDGAERNPSPSQRGVRSLRGAKAGRLVRALCDRKAPTGVRELAERATVDPGYTSRVLALLEEEDLVERGPRGEVILVRWRDLLGLWVRDYQIGATNRTLSCLAPLGLDSFRASLSSLRERYAVTGVDAVPSVARVLPSSRVRCYVDDPEAVMGDLGLVETDSGSNVDLIEPFDPVVYGNTHLVADLVVVAAPQCAIDLLSGSGREPTQGMALLDWMELNEDAWRLA